MKKTVFRFCMYIALVMGSFWWGCDGSPPREAVDETVKELSGQKHVERMKKMKKNIQTSQDQQTDRYHVPEADPEEKAPD
jgi:hypothetical protein